MAFVIEEGEIFKYLVQNEEDENYKRSAQYIQTFMARVPINIFNDEYYIMYEVMQELKRLKVGLTYDYLQAILSNTIRDLSKSVAVGLFKEEKLSENEYADKLMDYLLATYDSLSEAELEDENIYNASLQFYLASWQDAKVLELHNHMGIILMDGMQIGKQYYKGSTDANAYYIAGYNKIRQVVDGSDELLSQDINTATDTVEEVRDKLKDETATEIMTITGVNELDNHYDYHKGEIIIVQAGTGVGKTRFTMNLVYNAMKMGKNVLYISLEQKTQRIFPMLQARYILENYSDYPDMTDKNIIKNDYDFSRQSMIDDSVTTLVTDESWGKILLTGRKLRADELYNYLLDVWEAQNFHFDILVVDYIGLLGTTKDRYQELTDVANMFKAEVKSFKGVGFLAILPNQLSKEDEKELMKGNYDMSKLGGSETQYIVRASDYVYTLFQDEELRETSQLRVLIGKVRLGEIADSQVDVLAELGKIQFMDGEKYTDDEVD